MRRDHIKNLMIWTMIAPEIIEMIGGDQSRDQELIKTMIKNTGCRWHEIVLSYTYVEAISLRFRQ